MLSLFLTQDQIKKEVFQKMLTDISVRYLHNNMIIPSKNGGLTIVVDSATQKVLISDTTLRSFILP